MSEVSALSIVNNVSKTGFFQQHNKCQTLKALEGRVKTARVLPQYAFTVQEWAQDQNKILNTLEEQKFFGKKLIVRSSSSHEDSDHHSMAGAFESVLGVESRDDALAAITKVMESYDHPQNEDMIFIQPMLSDVKSNGVVFTYDPNNGGAYYVFDMVDSADTTAVTAGATNSGQTYYVHHSQKLLAQGSIAQVIALCDEVEEITQTECLDIEFAFNKEGELFLFQARPIVMGKPSKEKQDSQFKAIEDAAKLVSRINKKIPYVTGDKTLLGNMPDWNPAEMIGVRPKPLALSLYKEMITDRIWAYQRDKYGYKNLRSVPLLYSLAGSPFIDIRASFYSFIPKIVSQSLSGKLVDYYISRLESKPELHDKIEFDIVFSCFTPSVSKMLKALKEYGFSDGDLAELSTALRDLTNRMTHTETGEWRVDRGKVDILKQRQYKLKMAHKDYAPIDRLFWHAEDCKRYGTLPFAGLARAAFVATQFLNSLVEEGLLSPDRLNDFWRSIETIGGNLKRDQVALRKEDFLERYGHLRPGTYDIMSESYAEAPEKYFNWSNIREQGDHQPAQPFILSAQEHSTIQKMLDENGLQHTSESLFRFFKAAIEGREYGKFIFSWSINEILKELVTIGESYGISREDCAYVNIQSVLANYANSIPLEEVMRNSINLGKRHYETTLQITLPNIISSEKDLWVFAQANSLPNFITLQQANGDTVFVDSTTDHSALNGKIALITNADPGFDWILGSGIKGFITCYGGANSHMAVRAMELNLAAAIGVGERQFQKYCEAHSLALDCAGKRVVILS